MSAPTNRGDLYELTSSIDLSEIVRQVRSPAFLFHKPTGQLAGVSQMGQRWVAHQHCPLDLYSMNFTQLVRYASNNHLIDGGDVSPSEFSAVLKEIWDARLEGLVKHFEQLQYVKKTPNGFSFITMTFADFEEADTVWTLISMDRRRISAEEARRLSKIGQAISPNRQTVCEMKGIARAIERWRPIQNKGYQVA